MRPAVRSPRKCFPGGTLRILLSDSRAGRSKLLPHFVCVFLRRIIPYIVVNDITILLKIRRNIEFSMFRRYVTWLSRGCHSV